MAKKLLRSPIVLVAGVVVLAAAAAAFMYYRKKSAHAESFAAGSMTPQEIQKRIDTLPPSMRALFQKMLPPKKQ
jgi:hypothetical protein